MALTPTDVRRLKAENAESVRQAIEAYLDNRLLEYSGIGSVWVSTTELGMTVGRTIDDGVYDAIKNWYRAWKIERKADRDGIDYIVFSEWSFSDR